MSFLGITNVKALQLRNGLRFYGKEWYYMYPVYSVRVDYGNIKDMPSDAKTVVDIGAHIGTFSLQIAKSNPKLKVYSYEPNSVNYSYLDKNIKANNLQKRVIAIKKGVSSKKGTIRLYGDCASCSAEVGKEGKPCDTAKTVSLKDIFKDNKISRIDYLKMDCEGSEYGILNATPRDLLNKISLIALEYHEWNGHKLEELTSLLESCGFKITQTIKGSVPGVGIIQASRIQ